MRLLTLALALAFAAPAAAVPLQLTHQGRLSDSAGLPLEGAHQLTVALYADMSGGSPLWTDTIDANLQTGAFSVILGAGAPLDAALFDGSVRYVELAVDGGAPLPQRLPLTSVPYAMRAGEAATAGSAAVADALSAPLAWTDITGAPADADTLASLACDTGEVAAWDGASWACAEPSASTVDASTLTGTISIDNLPVGSSSGSVAAGDHTHGFGQITGQAAYAQLPVGSAANTVAAGNHTHDAAAIVSGTLAAARLPTTGYTDLELSGDLTADNGDFAGTIRVGGDGVSCTSANEGAIRYADGVFEGCTETGWVPLALQQDDGGTPSSAGTSCKTILALGGGRATGLYWIDPDGEGTGAAPFQAWCDMSTLSGGWTLALNLDTSDGHVMWWANPLWRNTSAHGTVETPFDGDHKSPAFSALTGTTDLLIVVHEQGEVKGWRAFRKTNTNTLASYLAGGDNTLISNSVIGSDISGLWANERLVRSSTDLYANRCIYGSCVNYGGGSPDGNRIGSTASQSSNNSGGGLGVWHDMGHCCASQSYGGVSCNGSAFRSTSEAQAGWYAPGYEQVGSFGSDTFGPWSGAATDSPCGNSAWTRASGQNYDYAIYLR